MSVNIDFFFNYPLGLTMLSESVNAALGCNLSPYEDNSEDLFCRFLGMEFSLSKHTLENDRECKFENYKFQIGFRVAAPDADLGIMQIPAIALVIYILFSRMGITGILVYDVQTLLVKYEEQIDTKTGKGDLYDVISNEFVSFPKHFSTIQKRIQNGELINDPFLDC